VWESYRSASKCAGLRSHVDIGSSVDNDGNFQQLQNTALSNFTATPTLTNPASPRNINPPDSSLSPSLFLMISVQNSCIRSTRKKIDIQPSECSHLHSRKEMYGNFMGVRANERYWQKCTSTICGRSDDGNDHGALSPTPNPFPTYAIPRSPPILVRNHAML
jgi:hypothetical protein